MAAVADKHPWRGWMLERFGGKTFEANAQDACRRLKRAAEARYRGQASEKG